MGGYRINKGLITYDPRYVIEHTDSSDFQDTSLNGTEIRRKIDINKAKKEYSNPHLNKVITQKPNRQTSDRNQTKEFNTCNCHHCGETVPRSTETCNFLNTYQNQNFNRVPSKTDLLKKKLSNIFFRSSRKKMCAINENDCRNNRKVYCANCRQRQMRKFQRKQLEQVARQVYLVEDLPNGRHDTPASSERYRQLTNIHSQLTCLSSNSETEMREKKQHKFRKEVELDKEIKKEYLKYRKRMENLLKHHPQVLQPYSKPKFHVLASQRYQNPKGAPTQPETNTDTNSLPTTASGFWDFFFNKINAKYQEAKSLSSSMGGISGNFGGQTKKSERHQECQTSFPFSSQVVSTSSQNFYSSTVMTSTHHSQLSPPLSPMRSSPMNVTRGNHYHYQKGVSPKSTQVSFEYKKGCQEPHELLTKVLADKYNGEILCIHNPPCVLINGCLNLPKESLVQSSNQPINVWPVVTPEKKPGYLASRKLKKSKKKTSEQACQHHPPFTEVQQYQAKSEKVIQSICNHSPPCKVVPGCARPQYDLQLDVSCVHVPMCKKVPECLVETEVNTSGYVCDHLPRCLDVPECQRVAFELSKGDVCTQVRAKMASGCRHQPPCIMIPSCLARLMCESVGALGGAIPDCTHLPPCELIPACCRRLAKDTVSNKIAKMVNSRKKRRR